MQKVLGEPLLAPRETEALTQEGQGELPKQALIVDIDSTLALLDRSPYNYDEVMYDTLNPVVYRMIMKYRRDGYHILILTGRPTSCADDTMKWLEMNHVPYDFLGMRTTGDKTPDTALKEILYNRYIKGKYEVELVLEDRTRMVRKWRELGLVCFQVCNGDY